MIWVFPALQNWNNVTTSNLSFAVSQESLKAPFSPTQHPLEAFTLKCKNQTMCFCFVLVVGHTHECSGITPGGLKEPYGMLVGIEPWLTAYTHSPAVVLIKSPKLNNFGIKEGNFKPCQSLFLPALRDILEGDWKGFAMSGPGEASVKTRLEAFQWGFFSAEGVVVLIMDRKCTKWVSYRRTCAGSLPRNILACPTSWGGPSGEGRRHRC